ncbi:hypothetical protein [Aliiruegeria sabulilitoris]|uniref:hypothetical protein n=1 Tax=Aliiruegeria sabulilitoris TaxID=1510458 RepID=UPI0012E35564|nr:hypothetical protein [Aliiruegeria sabulilitoris]
MIVAAAHAEELCPKQNHGKAMQGEVENVDRPLEGAGEKHAEFLDQVRFRSKGRQPEQQGDNQQCRQVYPIEKPHFLFPLGLISDLRPKPPIRPQARRSFAAMTRPCKMGDGSIWERKKWRG